MSAPDRNHRLLVFDCHEAWVYQLRILPQAMDVIVGLQGRHTANWDEAMRPIPATHPPAPLPAISSLTLANIKRICK